ncbi:MAG: sodium:solute symporter [Acidobacteriota bacterium]
MRPLDWAVLAASLAGIAFYGVWRGRGSRTTSQYLLAGKTMPWYAMALSIMATQASAITFISTTGQSYADGMRFVQMYLGLPLAMILISAFAVPRFHSSGVFTAYEYLEKRFDAKTRALAGAIFLLSRGLAVGVALSAPAVVLTVILGWSSQWTTLIMGVLVVAYTASGGIAAVTWTEFVQMMVMTAGIIAALFTVVLLLPDGVGLPQALAVAGAAGKLNAAVWRFDLSDQYNVWSGLIGGMFLALAYFGCDQSQVQRYLTGRSVAQSRLGLLFNGVAKIPMQFFILFTGAMVFVFYVYTQPPLVFHPQAMRALEQQPAYAQLIREYDRAFQLRRGAAQRLDLEGFRRAQAEVDEVRSRALALAGQATGQGRVNDTNYVFLWFVVHHIPAGVVGLIMAAIFAAAMSTISAEINSLATVSMVDIYRRFFRRDAGDRHYLAASRWLTVFWGAYAIVTALYAQNLGSLVEAVNRLGSLFYGTLLGVFVLAFFFPRVGGTAAFLGMILGEAVVFAVWHFSGLAFLWLNAVGCLAVIASGSVITWLMPRPQASG